MLRVRKLDLRYLSDIVVLNVNDARKLGVDTETRVDIYCNSNDYLGTVGVLLTEELVNEGELGVPVELAKRMGLEDNDVAEVHPHPHRRSIEYLRMKARGLRLGEGEIRSIIKDVVNGVLDDAGIAMFLALQETVGMDEDELHNLIKAMVETGETVDFEFPVYDEHSIGGIPGNSKVAMLAVPTAVSTGVKVPKTSSRAIVSPSGTADTMEVLARVDLSVDEIKEAVRKAGGTLAWTGRLNLAPADDIFVRIERRLSIDPPVQVVASILAKKVALRIRGLVLDLPVGPEAKLTSIGEAEKLAARFMTQTNRFGMSFRALITFGGEPIGFSIGPALEAREALETMINRKGSPSLVDKAMAIAGAVIELSGKAEVGEGARLARRQFESGKTLEVFRRIIEAQGGDPNIKPDDLPLGSYSETIYSTREGGIVKLSNKAFNAIARVAGAPHDKAAGVKLHVKIGYRIRPGDPLFTIYSSSEARLEEAVSLAKSLEPIEVGTMLLKTIP